MSLDQDLLRNAHKFGARLAEAQSRAEVAKADYHHTIRRLHFAGGSLREIAEALQLSHQRVHQIIDGSGGGRRWKLPAKGATEALACSFCGRHESMVNKLIAGPGTYICESCVELAEKVADDHQPRVTDRTHLEVAPLPADAPCSFCGKRATDTQPLVSGPGARICDPCLRLCREILAEELGR